MLSRMFMHNMLHNASRPIFENVSFIILAHQLDRSMHRSENIAILLGIFRICWMQAKDVPRRSPARCFSWGYHWTALKTRWRMRIVATRSDLNAIPARLVVYPYLSSGFEDVTWPGERKCKYHFEAWAVGRLSISWVYAKGTKSKTTFRLKAMRLVSMA